jgi:hypothetical protein
MVMKKSLSIAGQIALMIVASIAVFLLIMAVRPAAAHRMTSHDYRVAHWCTWSAASVCTKWKARGGKFNCAPNDMSVSCRDQRRRGIQ